MMLAWREPGAAARGFLLREAGAKQWWATQDVGLGQNTETGRRPLLGPPARFGRAFSQEGGTVSTHSSGHLRRAWGQEEARRSRRGRYGPSGPLRTSLHDWAGSKQEGRARVRSQATRLGPGRGAEEGARGGIGPFPFPEGTLPDAAGTKHRPNGTSFGSLLVGDDTGLLGYICR